MWTCCWVCPILVIQNKPDPRAQGLSTALRRVYKRTTACIVCCQRFPLLDEFVVFDGNCSLLDNWAVWLVHHCCTALAHHKHSHLDLWVDI
jgi:hypothetical protein